MNSSSRLPWLPLVAVLCLGWLASACSPLVRIEQPIVEDRADPLQQGGSAGQTFTAAFDGLSGFVVYLSPVDTGSGVVHLRLFSGPQSQELLAESQIPVAEVSAPGYYRFDFPVFTGSHRQAYYAEISLEGSGRVAPGVGPGEAYLQGAHYQDAQSQDDQLAFRLVYDRKALLAGLIREALGALLLLGAGFFLLTLPGWALIQLVAGTKRNAPDAAVPWPAWQNAGLISRLILASSAGAIVVPVLLLAASLLGLQPGALAAWLPSLAASAWLLWQSRRSRPGGLRFAIARVGRGWRANPPWPALALLAVFAALVLTRFWTARSLPAPLFGDSFQHTLITQLILDHGGLFSSWAPYAELQTFTYHFAFHSLSAALAWLLRLPADQAVLWMGQLLNLLAVLALYPLAARAGRSPWAGVAAVLVAGLLSPMPNFYLNWGRYTQLTGQVLLPLAFLLAWDSLQEPAADPRSRFDRLRLPLLTGLVFGGLSLAHYRVLILAALFMAVALVGRLLSGPRRADAWLIPLVRSLLAALVAGVIFLPWFLRSFSGNLLHIFSRQISPSTGVPAAAESAAFFSNLTAYLPAGLWLMMLVSLCWGLWRRERWAALLGAWSLGALLVANPNWLHLPGAGAVDNFAVFIAAYIPAGLLIGSACGWLVNDLHLDGPLPHLKPGASFTAPLCRLRGAVLLFAVLLFSAWGVQQRVGDIHPAEFALVTYPDRRAAAWIEAHTPAEARFLVNSLFAYGGTSVAGSDGGWWLPWLARRQVTLPPLNYALEGEPRSGYRQWVNELPARLEELGPADPAVLALLQERGVTHVYLGQQQGRVNDAQALLSPQVLLSDAHYRPVYHQDRVWIFEVNP